MTGKLFGQALQCTNGCVCPGHVDPHRSYFLDTGLEKVVQCAGVIGGRVGKSAQMT